MNHTYKLQDFYTNHIDDNLAYTFDLILIIYIIVYISQKPVKKLLKVPIIDLMNLDDHVTSST